MADSVTTLGNNATRPFIVRPFIPENGPAVERIIRESPQAAPWIPAALKDSWATGASAGRVFLVAECAGEVSGFILGQQIADEGEILNLAVLPGHRRSGQASSLLATAVSEFRSCGALRIFLEVRESNTAAISFYTKHGFTVIGRRPGYYHEPDEAALQMMREVNGPKG